MSISNQSTSTPDSPLTTSTNAIISIPANSNATHLTLSLLSPLIYGTLDNALIVAIYKEQLSWKTVESGIR